MGKPAGFHVGRCERHRSPGPVSSLHCKSDRDLDRRPGVPESGRSDASWIDPGNRNHPVTKAFLSLTAAPTPSVP